MRIGYIIVAHTLPDHLVRLVRRLETDSARFFVHVDRRSPGSVMSVVERELGDSPNVHLLPRHRCHWASFSLVEAALKGIRALLDSPEDIEYGVLLTGQDYPLRRPEEIERVLAEAEGRSFLAHHRSEGRELRRVTRWHWHGTVLGRPRRLPNRWMPLSFKRTLPDGLEPFSGSAHWCLSRRCLEYVISRDPKLIRFFRWSAVPDEAFFQTILLSSPLAGTIVNHDLRYAVWPEAEIHPRVLTIADLDGMLASDALFARKFDPRVDRRVIDTLDATMDLRGQ